MKHILITGMSGVGKTTVATALQSSGMKAIDMDLHLDLCRMYYKNSYRKNNSGEVEQK